MISCNDGLGQATPGLLAFRPARPAKQQPGSYCEQHAAIDYYVDDIPRRAKRTEAGRTRSWAAARWQCIPHVRGVVS